MMATLSRSIRRGLPRVEGGDPWPAAGQAPARIVTAGAAARRRLFPGRDRSPPRQRPPRPPPPLPPAQETAPGATAVSAPVPAVNAGAAVPRQLRRGLPRVPGGEPWPPAGEVPVSVAALSGAPAAGAAPAPARCCCGCCRGAAAESSAGSDVACSCSGHRTRHTDDGNHLASPRASPRPRWRTVAAGWTCSGGRCRPCGAGGSRTHCPGPCPGCQRGGDRCRGGAAGGRECTRGPRRPPGRGGTGPSPLLKSP